MPSGARRIRGGMSLLEAPLPTMEFLAVDTETNGLAGDRCELTEIGAVLVGGGELHDRWSTLVRPVAPLGRGIQRFTGITQAMADEAPEAPAVLPRLPGNPQARAGGGAGGARVAPAPGGVQAGARAGGPHRGFRRARAPPGFGALRPGRPRPAGAVHGRAGPAAAPAPAPPRPG